MATVKKLNGNLIIQTPFKTGVNSNITLDTDTVIVSGNLTVRGNTTIISSNTQVINDNIITVNDIPLCCPIDADCKYLDIVNDFKGIFILDAETDIIKYLKLKNQLQKTNSMHAHSTPHDEQVHGLLLISMLTSK